MHPALASAESDMKVIPIKRITAQSIHNIQVSSTNPPLHNMNRGYHVEHYNVRPAPNKLPTYGFETKTHPPQYHKGGRHVTHNPIMEKVTTEDVLFRPRPHDTQRSDHLVGSNGHLYPVNPENGQHAQGHDYLDYVSHLEKTPSMGFFVPEVHNQHGTQEKQVVYEEYVTTDEEYDSDTQEIVKMKVTTRVEKRGVKW